MAEPDLLDEDGLPVLLPSGAVFKVLTGDEKDYVSKRVQEYTTTFRWENTSDLQDVDRVLILELFVFRYGLWLSRTKDYWDDPCDDQKLQKSLHDLSGELRQLKKHLGMDKVSRDRERGDDSVPAYLEKLRQRAKKFGVNREGMLDKGIELSQQLTALYTLHKNCDDQERIEQRCRAEDLIQWIGDVFVPEFEKVDEHFRVHEQSTWIQEM